ncbi:AraC family transcriptional regulator [Anaeromyxobacter oryzisoli]|uniref:AraC family transcriptional regulator n=1 Tax=Anaeromyxobacter oryzisoli TaxID=2925408 RepID=UPI001F593B60|nr:AraC family transcriptional regulator [Anaeromyxobacter sp. SG63]
MNTAEKDTVSMHFVEAAVARLSGEARARVLATAGIPAELLGAPQARVTADAFSALWLAVSRELDDEFFGLDRRRMKCGSFALLCHAALHTGTVAHALKRILRGFAVFLDDVHGELRVEGREAVVELVSSIEPLEARRFADETLLILVHGLTCWLAGRRIPLTLAEFSEPRPPHAQEYAVMYSQRLRFDAARTAVRFDAAQLAAPVIQDEASLATFLRTAPRSVFLKYKNEAGWAARLRRRLRGSIGKPEWPVLEDVARELHVAPTTLRRRLEAEGTSYQAIKDELRRDAAVHQLCGTRLSIAEIASALGFQETSAFHRAFKRWSGVQPGEYRRRAGREGDEARPSSLGPGAAG